MPVAILHRQATPQDAKAIRQTPSRGHMEAMMEALPSLVVKLLRAAWVAMVLLAISSRWIGFVDRLADHGKLIRVALEEKLPVFERMVLRWTVPKRLFYHFYLVAAIWSAMLFAALWRQKSSSMQAFLTLGLLELHALRRLYESLYVFRYGDAKMHVVAYLVGIGHYILAALSLAIDPSSSKPALSTGLHSIMAAVFGVAIFALGSYHQWICHNILGGLRKSTEAVAACTHSVPRGDWFELVTCPHYLGECLIYLGIFVAGGLANLTAFALWLWVVVNLGITAQKTRRWYIEKFDDYPSGRKAIIPGVW